MMNVIPIEMSDQWDQIVKSFHQYDVYWLSGYVKAFQSHGDGIPVLFHYEDGNVRGINVVMKRDIAAHKKFTGKIPTGTYWDFSTPYGYGGWLIEGKDTAALEKAYEEYCIDNGIISEFVRFHPMLGNQEAVSDFYEVIPLGLTVAMDLASEEIIWENIISKNRNVIRKAEKNGVVIKHGMSPDLLEEFRGIYNMTMEKDNADPYYFFGKEFYESIINDLSDAAEYFYAVLNGRMIAGAIMIYANGRMNYHLSGSLREFSSLAPGNLMLYEAAKWGSEQGLKTLYLGGGVGSGEDGLFKFKRAFYKGDLHRFYIGKKIYIEEKYDKLVSMRSDIPQGSYFPSYRSC